MERWCCMFEESVSEWSDIRWWLFGEMGEVWCLQRTYISGTADNCNTCAALDNCYTCVSLALDNNPPTGARGPLSTAAHCWLADWTMFWCIASQCSALECSALLSCQREASAFGRGVTLSSHCLPSHLQLGGATAPVWGHIWKHTVEKSQTKLLLQYQCHKNHFNFKIQFWCNWKHN